MEFAQPRDLYTAANLRKFDRPWAEKEPTAFFRGTATGGGVTIETNQRLHISWLSHEWSKNPRLSGTPPPPASKALTDTSKTPPDDVSINTDMETAGPSSGGASMKEGVVAMGEVSEYKTAIDAAIAMSAIASDKNHMAVGEVEMEVVVPSSSEGFKSSFCSVNSSKAADSVDSAYGSSAAGNLAYVRSHEYFHIYSPFCIRCMHVCSVSCSSYVFYELQCISFIQEKPLRDLHPIYCILFSASFPPTTASTSTSTSSSPPAVRDPNSFPYLDAKITGWNRRDKKIASRAMTFLTPKSFPFDGGRENFVEIYMQSKYKYVVSGSRIYPLLSL